MFRHNLLKIDENVVLTMLTDARYKLAFPCIDSAAKKLANIELSCQTCNKVKAERAKLIREVVQGVQNCLAGLPGTAKRRLLQLTEAKQIRVYRQNSTGQIVPLTFHR